MSEAISLARELLEAIRELTRELQAARAARTLPEGRR
jgi:hypothetical protein